jgi:transposase InsO family protein
MSDLFRSDKFDKLRKESELQATTPANTPDEGAAPGTQVPAELHAPQDVLPPRHDDPTADGLIGVERAVEAEQEAGESGWPGDLPPIESGMQRKPLAGRRKGCRLVRRDDSPRTPFTPEQRLLILDTWQRSGLPAGDFAPLFGLSKHTPYAWKKQFDLHGTAGLMEQPRGVRTGSRLPEVTKRSILLLKQSHPDWGCQRISDMLLRGPALPASASAVARVLHEAGYELEEVTTRPHPDKPRRFERARPNQLWQTDLFTFVLKRQNRRVYLVAFLDDHSRFITGYGLHASQSTALVLEVLRAAIGSYGPPDEVLTDNGAQYVTWRGKSAFT